jgi:hypothetical protein
MTRPHPWHALAAGVVLGAIAACASPQRPSAWEERSWRAQEILTLESQIRDYRRQLGLQPNPDRFYFQAPIPLRTPAAGTDECRDVCDLARYICGAKDDICRIAGELGDDPWASGKCEKAKASCREANQRCKDCE